jgi:hypothetical protein
MTRRFAARFVNNVFAFGAGGRLTVFKDPL